MTTIVTRAGKGSALTHNEVDSNFINLNNAKYESGNNATFGTVGGTTITASTGFSGALNGTVGASTPAAGTFTSLSDSGNLTFTGTGNRITGDFSNATLANRVAFQTSTTNGSTTIMALPNGTGPNAQLLLRGSSVPQDDSFGQVVLAGGSDFRIGSGASGTGSYLPMTFYTGGSERMRIDSSGNVGIGTSSPDRLLSVYSSGQEWPMLIRGASNTVTNRMGVLLGQRARGSIGSPSVVTADTILGGFEVGGYNGSAYTYGFNGGASVFMYAADTWTSTSCPTYLTFSTNSPGVAGYTERMRINADGSIRMNCNGSVISHAFGYNENGGQIYLYDETGVGATLIDQASNNTRVLELINGSNLLLGLGGSNTTGSIMFMGAGYAERMRIDSSGNVGIGTTSPSHKLDVLGNARSSSATSSNAFFLAQNSVGSLYLIQTSAYGAIYTPTNQSLVFDINGGEKARIDSSGNVLFNTTDTTLFNNTSGNGVCYRVNASLDVAASSDNCLILNRMTSTGPIAEFRYSGTIVGSISVTGSATAYNTSSDYRLKENITPITGALEKVALLNPVNWTWKSDGSDGQGFIAHELQSVVPDCVTGEKDAVDADGNPIYQGVDTSFLVATLTKAIQELKAELDTVKAELNTLKGN